MMKRYKLTGQGLKSVVARMARAVARKKRRNKHNDPHFWSVSDIVSETLWVMVFVAMILLFIFLFFVLPGANEMCETLHSTGLYQ